MRGDASITSRGRFSTGVLDIGVRLKFREQCLQLVCAPAHVLENARAITRLG
jgi:hypothetical protein